MAKDTPNPVGRPRAGVDPKILEELAGIGCTMIEMAKVTGVSVDTLERNFADVIQKGREDFKMSLRRRQREVAMFGSKKGEHANPTMLIWLGKQHLDQRDKQEVSGPGGGPIQHEHFDLSKLDNEQLATLEQLVESATSAVKDSGERRET